MYTKIKKKLENSLKKKKGFEILNAKSNVPFPFKKKKVRTEIKKKKIGESFPRESMQINNGRPVRFTYDCWHAKESERRSNGEERGEGACEGERFVRKLPFLREVKLIPYSP